MERKVAKELLHIDGWLKRVDEVVDRGEAAYLDEALLQEAGDSLMMKVGEAANRLARMGVLEPDGVQWALAVANRNFLIHQYDQINRSLTWLTLARDLPAWRKSLQALTAEARGVIGDRRTAEGRFGLPSLMVDRGRRDRRLPWRTLGAR